VFLCRFPKVPRHRADANPMINPINTAHTPQLNQLTQPARQNQNQPPSGGALPKDTYTPSSAAKAASGARDQDGDSH